ncbi:Histidine phosphatase family protein [Balamuthia mandrillaris]
MEGDKPTATETKDSPEAEEGGGGGGTTQQTHEAGEADEPEVDDEQRKKRKTCPPSFPSLRKAGHAPPSSENQSQSEEEKQHQLEIAKDWSLEEALLNRSKIRSSFGARASPEWSPSPCCSKRRGGGKNRNRNKKNGCGGNNSNNSHSSAGGENEEANLPPHRKPDPPLLAKKKEPDSSKFRILLVRHGESLANVDPLILTKMSDHTIPLSERGKAQAQEVGSFLKKFYEVRPHSGNGHKKLWVSPYKRTRDTAKHICNASEVWFDVEECIVLGEQQFGLFEGINAEDIAQIYPKEHEHFVKAINYGGRFWARMPLGESRFDVAVRVNAMIQSLFQDQCNYGIEDVVIVSHGMTLRAFAMMWLGRTPEWLENERNPENCSIRLLKGRVDKGYIFEGYSARKEPIPAAPSPSPPPPPSLSVSPAPFPSSSSPAPSKDPRTNYEWKQRPNLPPEEREKVRQSEQEATDKEGDAERREKQNSCIQKIMETEKKSAGGKEKEKQEEENEQPKEGTEPANEKVKEKEKKKEKETEKDQQVLVPVGLLQALHDKVNHLERKIQTMENNVASIRDSFTSRVFVDKNPTWIQRIDCPTWTTLITRNLCLAHRGHITAMSHGTAVTVNPASNGNPCLDVGVFVNGELFSQYRPEYGHGTAIMHGNSWTPVMAIAAMELDSGSHTVEVRCKVRGQTHDSVFCHFNGAVLITTIHPVLSEAVYTRCD